MGKVQNYRLRSLGALAPLTGIRPPLIVHAWSDYVPDTFVEPNSFLITDPRFDSLNFVGTLWDNGKSVDEYTLVQRKRNAKNLTNPSLVFRLTNRLFRKIWWRNFRHFLETNARSFGASLIHSHFGTTGCELLDEINNLGLPHVVTIYGYDGSAVLRDPKLMIKYKRMFSDAARIIVLCEEVKRRLVAAGCHPKKITVWNMPAGVENYPYAERKPGKQVRLLMAARFAEAKGHVYSLQAVKNLIEKGRDIHLTLVGYGNLTASIRAKISELGLEKHVTLIDNRLAVDFASAYLKLLRENDIYVLPSITDRFGTDEAGPSLTMICAQAAGLPVICTPFPGSEISMRHGVTGYYCREKDSQSLAARIELLIEQPNKWNKFGKAGSVLANQEFSEIAQMEKLVAVYRESLGFEVEQEPTITGEDFLLSAEPNQAESIIVGNS